MGIAGGGETGEGEEIQRWLERRTREDMANWPMQAGRLRSAIRLIIVSFGDICPRIRKLLISEMSLLWTGVYSLLWVEVAVLTVRHIFL